MLAENVTITTIERSTPARRILLVVHGYPPQQTMGAEMQARRKACWWQAQGHQVAILTVDPQSAEQLPFGQIEERFEEVDGLEVCRVRVAVPDATQSLRDTYAHPLLAATVERELRRVRPDLVYQVSGYLFGIAPLQIAARLGIPTVLFAMDYWHICQRVTLLRPDGACCPGPRDPADCAACRIADRGLPQRLGPTLNRQGRQLLAAVARHAPVPLAARLGVDDFAARRDAIAEVLAGVGLVVVNSQFLGEQLVRLGFPRERLLVVRQGIDGQEFAAPYRQSAAAGGALRVRYLGQINRHKGTDLLVDAVAQLRAAGLPIRLSLHGPVTATPEYLALLRARIGSDTDGIVIGASLDRPGLVAALRETDVLVVPSRWYENSPNVILEAFAAGVPVITADHGGMAEMVRDGVDGLLFRPGDVASLAATLRRLALDSDLLVQLRSGVRRPYGLDEEMIAEEAALDRLLAGAGVAR